MLRFLHRHILLPAFESGFKRRNTFRYWQELERSQWLSRAALEQIQFDALQRLIEHAFRHCPYYRAAWLERGLDPRRLQGLSDIHQWPLLDREAIRRNRTQMRAQAPGMRLLHKS